MLFESLFQKWNTADFDRVLESFAAEKAVRISGLKGSSRAIHFSLLQRHLNLPVVWITSNTGSAEDHHTDLAFAGSILQTPPESVLYYPEPDTEPYQGFSPHPQISVTRMQALWKVLQKRFSILVLPLSAAMRRLPPPDHFRRNIFSIEWGEDHSPLDLAARLRALGYTERDLVTSRGEFALRGGILDLFSPAENAPTRLEFFGNRIEAMRSFDSASQRSLGDIENITGLALKEMQLSREEINNWAELSSGRWSGDFYHEELTDKTEQLLESGYFEGYEEFVTAFYPKPATIFDYLPKDCCVILEEPAALETASETIVQHYRKRYEQIHETYRIALEPQEIFQTWDQLHDACRSRFMILLSDLVAEPDQDIPDLEYSFQSGRQYQGHMQEIVNDALRLQENGFTTFYIFPTAGKAERLAEILTEYGAPVSYFQSPLEPVESPVEKRIVLCIGNLRHGFRNPEMQIALFTEDDLFGESRAVEKTVKRAAGKFLSDLRDLKIDDYVVHVDHGIGQFLGLTTMPMEGQDREFLLLRFADDDKLYVPVERLDLVQKYMGASEVSPRLDKLGSNLWQKTKSRAKASMKEMAEKLLQLYAYRKTVKGHAFPEDDMLQREFEDAFEFQETPHQMIAIEDVKADMESEKPADRLICGDVGYGKTEVAMRAAFKAVNAGKQVAVLAPTTILAFQHYHTFQKRFEMFPVRIEMISRFRSRAEIKKILEQTAQGKIDILIGTHRLLSKDVLFRDLGLLVVDEEQRFGVGHKERLKEIKKNVDAITLTATPIPRTLQMALMGFRPMSVIETPPKDRLAIQTNIVKYSEDTIGSAIRAELRRGGQVYFVHNRVETIHSIAALVQRLVPEARLGTAHGQMEESDLEQVMLRFIRHEFDVLISTTIIENGIDIPLVNTLIVNRADRFGLSQLYQLRGRVGRSHRRAYAYFLIPSEKDLTPIARKRLSALKEFTDLGSGFRLAALDLEIRGAGNLLGAEQHGHIAALGFELYCRMLEQTVKEMQGEQEPEFSTNINLNLDIRIPEDYVPNMNLRLNLYKRIAVIQSDEQVTSMREEIQDRFGNLPESVDNLLEYGRVKWKAEALRIKSIDQSDGSLYFQLGDSGKIQVDTILSFLKQHKGSSLSPSGVLKYEGEKLHIPRNLLSNLNQILTELT